MDRSCSKQLAVEQKQAPKRRAAERVRLVQDRLEDRRELARRAVDDLQHLGGGGLLLQCLARLVDEPRVFHCDDRLRSEVL